jgi:hypothetical protein
VSDTILMRRAPAAMQSPQPWVLVPVNDRGRAEVSKIPLGETVVISIMRDRSLPQHRLFFGILDHVAKASAFETAERLLVALKVRLGRYDLMKLPNGQVVPVPQSISFAKMGTDDFQKFFDDSVRLICDEVIPGTNASDLVDEVQLMLQPRNSAGGPPDRSGEGDPLKSPSPPRTRAEEKIDVA